MLRPSYCTSSGAEAYAAALAEHRGSCARPAPSRAGSRWTRRETPFFVAFPTAPGALEAAAQITERLAGRPIRVRIGLAHGDAVLTDEGYAGTDVHRAARIAASASGGQILVSESTRAPTRGRRPRPRPASLQGSRSGGARLPARSQEFPPGACPRRTCRCRRPRFSAEQRSSPRS